MNNTKVLSVLGLMTLTTGAAVAASDAPTLSSLFGSSGVNVSGALAASLQQNADNAQNSFQVDQAFLSLAYQPSQGVGAVLDLASGETLSGQGGAIGASNTSSTAITQAYGQYKKGALTLMGGRFYTAAGYEAFPVTGNLFVSHSLAFNAEPTYHTGGRASYAFSDELNLSIGVLNNVYAVNNEASSTLKNKTAELKVSWNPSANLSLGLTHLRSRQETDFLGLVAGYTFSKELNFALSVDRTRGVDSEVYKSVTLYATYALNEKTKVGLRLEDISWENDLNLPDHSHADAGAWAAVISYAAAKNFDFRTEVSDVDLEGGIDRDVRAAIQGVLKF